MEAREIRSARVRRVVVEIPPSKSYTARALIAAALADGESTILNPSRSTDSATMVSALRAFGIPIEDRGSRLVVRGCGGRIAAADRTIDVGNAGTCMRFLTAFASLAPGTTVLTGDRAMLARPAGPLSDALAAAGVRISTSAGHPPVTVRGGLPGGGRIPIDASASSQFLSALLLIAPYADRPVEIAPSGTVASAPYAEMTAAVMRRFGAVVERSGSAWRVDAPREYAPAEFAVEADASSAAFFGAAAAIVRGVVRIPGIGTGTLQGDIRFFDLLRGMGCDVRTFPDAIEVCGAPLRGISADLNDIPDSVPALAVTAAFAAEPTAILNVAHLRHKESDRLSALASELDRIGAGVRIDGGGLTVIPGALRGATIETYDDHRIAMGFAVAGLAVPGMRVSNPGCVAKSFPGFWTELEKFY